VPFLGWENELKEKNMKKILMTLMASMLLLSSTTYAVEMSKSHNPAMQMTTMSKSEAIQMLKDAGVEPSKIAMLENGEMAKTEGEGWWWLVAAAVAFLLSGDSQRNNNSQNGVNGSGTGAFGYTSPGKIW